MVEKGIEMRVDFKLTVSCLVISFLNVGSYDIFENYLLVDHLFTTYSNESCCLGFSEKYYSQKVITKAASFLGYTGKIWLIKREVLFLAYIG